MTREEAIKILTHIRNGKSDLMLMDALDMAIKALEQEPSGDLIRRQAVIDACEQSINILEAVDRIMDLPSVEQEPCSNCCNGNQIEKAKLCQKSYLAGMEHKQEPKTGHWIYTGDYLTEGMLKCSECGEEIDVSESYYDFCPVCGARMVEESEEV